MSSKDSFKKITDSGFDDAKSSPSKDLKNAHPENAADLQFEGGKDKAQVEVTDEDQLKNFKRIAE